MRTKAKNLLDFDVRLRRLAEEDLPELGNCRLPGLYRPVRSRAGVFEDAVYTHQRHHTGNVLAVERVIELDDEVRRRT